MANAPKPLSAFRYVVKDHEYSSTRHEGQRLVTTTGPRPFTMKEASHERHLAYVADFTIEINIPEIIDAAVRACCNTKGGRSKLLGGLIVTRGSNQRTTKNELKERPVYSGYELVKILVPVAT